jgi:Cytokinin dehydrogenase 1, FAD and cytokinin binding
MDSSRRAILIAGLAAMAASGRAGRAATEGASVAQPGQEAPPPLDGTLRFDDDSRAAGSCRRWTLYPVSAFPMSRDDWRRHFGPAWARLRDGKQNFDPTHVVTPGYEVF